MYNTNLSKPCTKFFFFKYIIIINNKSRLCDESYRILISCLIDLSELFEKRSVIYKRLLYNKKIKYFDKYL